MTKRKRIHVWVQKFADRDNLVLQWFDPETGKRCSLSAETSDPDQAEIARADHEADLNKGTFQRRSKRPARDPALLTWKQFRERFEDEHAAGLRENTQRNYRVALDLFERIAGPEFIAEVDEKMVSTFVADLRKERGCKPGSKMKTSSIKVRLQFLRTAFTWAAGQKIIRACPAFPAVKVPKKKPQPVPEEDFEKLLAQATDAQTRGFLLACWLAGLRLNEALAMEWSRTEEAPYIDKASDRIVFPAEVVKAAEDQWVPLDPKLWAALDALPRTGKTVFRFDAIDGRGDRQVTDITISARVRKMATAAGLNLTPKSLRRGFGCRYAAKVPAQVLQRLMRHASIRTTMDYYANVDEAAMRAVLGEKCNEQCNTPAQRSGVTLKLHDANQEEEKTSA